MSYGNEWDTYSASMNETTARVRRATEKLRTAEALAAVAASGDSSFNPLAAARASAWEAYGLYWEHDWTADGPVPQQERAAWQIRVQQRISGYVDSLYELAAQKVGSQISAHGGNRICQQSAH